VAVSPPRRKLPAMLLFLRKQKSVFDSFMRNVCLKTRYVFEMTYHFERPVKSKFQVLSLTLIREQVFGEKYYHDPTVLVLP
jgi:hypothetical protein